MPTLDELRLQTLRGIVEELVKADDAVHETGIIADRATRRLFDAYERGERWAEEEVRRRCRRGVYEFVYRGFKTPRSDVWLSTTGEVINMPSFVGAVIEKKQGVSVFQQRLWYEIPWAVFFEVGERRRCQANIYLNEVRAFEEIGELYPRFPDTRTPGEACALAGIDPAEFKLEGLFVN